MNWLIEDVSRGVYPCIYGPRCIRRGCGGNFEKRRAKTLRGAPAGAMVGLAGPT